MPVFCKGTKSRLGESGQDGHCSTTLYKDLYRTLFLRCTKTDHKTKVAYARVVMAVLPLRMYASGSLAP
jgi:hypothetical protein